ncbi:MAG TPA: FtsQ-type POTRA domain-containing protein [Vicinamibacterales bacterium]|nr:FtsQ-type POTRA domain-containing protein [Vicinamibacterales bacterium]
MWALLVVALAAGLPRLAAQAPVVAGIQIQGNTATSDDEVRRLADIHVGMPFDDAMIEQVATRLRAAKRFEQVEVRKRFASIADPSQIMLVIVVDEGPVKIVMTGDPEHPTKVVRKRFPNLLILPILRRDDEVGITYGVRLTAPEPRLFGKNSAVTYPVSWGGDKHAGVDVEKRFDAAVIDRLTFGGSVSRRENPALELDETRARVFVRGERELVHGVRVGADTGWQRASFEGTADYFTQVRTDIIADTRIDPILARNALYGRASIEHLQFADTTHPPVVPSQYAGYSGGVNRTELDGRGYLGFIGQTVLAARVRRLDSDRPLPVYMQPQIGGMSTVRGFPAGYAIGDTLVSMSGEFVVPLTSPVRIAKFGVTAFMDRGTVYHKGESFGDQPILEGYGGSVWLAAAFFRLNVAIAHGRGAPDPVRVHVGGNVTF